MSFIAKHITHHNERLIYLARLHWIYLVKGFFWILLLGAIGIFINWQVLFNFGELPSDATQFIPYPYSIMMDLAPGLVPIIVGMMLFLVYLFKWLGTEIALTDKRLIFKTGLFFVQTSEVELAEIAEAKVNNGWFGVLLGYGNIHLDCRFVGDFEIPIMKDPYKIIRQMNKLRSHGEQHPVI